MLFCKAGPPPPHPLLFLHIYIFHEESTCTGGLQAAILTKENPAFSVSNISPAPKKAPQ